LRRRNAARETPGHIDRGTWHALRQVFVSRLKQFRRIAIFRVHNVASKSMKTRRLDFGYERAMFQKYGKTWLSFAGNFALFSSCCEYLIITRSPPAETTASGAPINSPPGNLRAVLAAPEP
jgi:hypothetical protein